MVLSERHAIWLEERGLDVEKAAQIGVGSQGPRIAFPYTKAGNVVYSKLRMPEDKSNTIIKPTGQTQDFFWLEDTLPKEPKALPLIITEGELDALAVLQVGYQCVISLPSGAAGDLKGAINKVSRVVVSESDGQRFLKPTLSAFVKFVIATDNDQPGDYMRDALIELLGTDRCWKIKYPDGCKDPNDVLRIHGSEYLYDIIDNAEPLERGGFIPLTKIEEPPISVFSTGLPFIDAMIKPAVPSLMVIGGEANHGKSTFAQMLAFNLVGNNLLTKNNALADSRFRVAMFHGEGAKEIVVKRARNFMRARAKGVQPSVIDAWIDKHFGFIKPDAGENPSFEWLLEEMQRARLVHGCTVFIVDPWNQIDVARRSHESETEKTRDVIKALHRMANRLGLFLIVVHHVAKRRQDDGPPDKYALSGSQHWANAPDYVVMIWKEEADADFSNVIVHKVKEFGLMGRPGNRWIKYDNDRFTMTDAGPDRESKIGSGKEGKMAPTRDAQKAAHCNVASNEPSPDEPLQGPVRIN